MDEVKNFVCQFPNPWALRVSGMGENKSKSLHPSVQAAPAEICKLHQLRYASCTSSDTCMQIQRRYESCATWAMRAALAEVCKFFSWGMQIASAEICKKLQRRYTSCLADVCKLLAEVWKLLQLQLRHASCFRWSIQAAAEIRKLLLQRCCCSFGCCTKTKKDYYCIIPRRHLKKIDVTARLFIFNIVYVCLPAFSQICLILGKQHLLLRLKPRKAAALVAFNAYRKVLNLKKYVYLKVLCSEMDKPKVGGLKFFFPYYFQHCFISRPSDSTVPQDAGIKPRTVAIGALAVRRSIH